MVGESVESNFPPGLAVKGRDIVERERIPLRLLAAIPVEQQDGPAVAPGRGIFLIRGDAAESVIRIGGELHGFGCKKPGGLVMPVTAVTAAPAVDDHRGAIA